MQAAEAVCLREERGEERDIPWVTQGEGFALKGRQKLTKPTRPGQPWLSSGGDSLQETAWERVKGGQA